MSGHGFVGTALAFCMLACICVHLFVPDGFIRGFLLVPAIVGVLGLGRVNDYLRDREPIEPSGTGPAAGAVLPPRQSMWTQARRYRMWAVPLLYTLGIVLVDRFVPGTGAQAWRNSLAVALMLVALGTVAREARRVAAATRPRPVKPQGPAEVRRLHVRGRRDGADQPR
ncbi:hypothetical protein GCM10009661_50810 [Catellatospora chokoriensis]